MSGRSGKVYLLTMNSSSRILRKSSRQKNIQLTSQIVRLVNLHNELHLVRQAVGFKAAYGGATWAKCFQGYGTFQGSVPI